MWRSQTQDWQRRSGLTRRVHLGSDSYRRTGECLRHRDGLRLVDVDGQLLTSRLDLQRPIVSAVSFFDVSVLLVTDFHLEYVLPSSADERHFRHFGSALQRDRWFRRVRVSDCRHRHQSTGRLDVTAGGWVVVHAHVTLGCVGEEVRPSATASIHPPTDTSMGTEITPAAGYEVHELQSPPVGIVRIWRDAPATDAVIVAFTSVGEEIAIFEMVGGAAW